MHKHSSAVTAATCRGCCRTVQALQPIYWQVVWSLASHWHISFSPLFSRRSLSLSASPCLSVSPFPLILNFFSGIKIGCCQVLCVCRSSGGEAVAGGRSVRFNRQTTEDVRFGTRLEDAWEDRLSVDVYLWRKACFYQHLGWLLMRCRDCIAFPFALSVSPSVSVCISVCVGVHV